MRWKGWEYEPIWNLKLGYKRACQRECPIAASSRYRYATAAPTRHQDIREKSLNDAGFQQKSAARKLGDQDHSQAKRGTEGEHTR
jgi:hypothetical protein